MRLNLSLYDDVTLAGDALGDLYFYLGQFLLPLECLNVSAQSRAHFDCDNPERISKKLVVTQVNLTMDSRVTGYSGCNLCIRSLVGALFTVALVGNGTDPFTHEPCKVGTYTCDCETDHSGGPHCDQAKVGEANITGLPASTFL